MNKLYFILLVFLLIGCSVPNPLSEEDDLPQNNNPYIVSAQYYFVNERFGTVQISYQNGQYGIYDAVHDTWSYYNFSSPSNVFTTRVDSIINVDFRGFGTTSPGVFKTHFKVKETWSDGFIDIRTLKTANEEGVYADVNGNIIGHTYLSWTNF